MIQYWENMISREIGAVDKAHAAVLLPVSAVEQHGPHLPVGTDAIILRALLKNFSKVTGHFQEDEVIIAPQITVGKSNEHMDFPGTMTLTAKTMYDVIDEYTAAIAKWGFRKLILTNSHGGNTDLLNLLSRDLRIKYGMEIYVFDWWFTDFWKEILQKVQESKSPYGVFHACELETSLMLHIAPQMVDMEQAKDETPDRQFEGDRFISLYGPVTMGWKTRDVSHSGVIGDPEEASAEKGQVLMDFAVQKLTAIIEEILQFHY